mgnify:FL=1
MRERATDWNHPTGAVVVLDGQIIGLAADRSRLKSKKLLRLHKKGLCIRKFFKTPSGKRYWLCPGCSLPQHHAEPLAVKDARKHQTSIEGGDLYLYGHWWCCKPCWDTIIKTGIKNVYLMEGSYKLFNKSNPTNIVGRDFEL